MNEDKIPLSWDNSTSTVPNTFRQSWIDEDFNDVTLATEDDQQSNLKTHKSKYEGLRYNCGQCDYRSGRQNNLKTHKQSKHEGFRYNCDQCDFKATVQSYLRDHQQIKYIIFRWPGMG